MEISEGDGDIEINNVFCVNRQRGLNLLHNMFRGFYFLFGAPVLMAESESVHH
jgi:hypothetical protein